MAVISSIGVNIVAHSAGFIKGLKRATGALGPFTSALRRVGSLATLAVGGGLSFMAKGIVDTVDHVSKLSDRLGATTEDLVAMNHAAELTGLGQDQLSKGLQAMSRRLGQAKQGSGQAARALDVLGLSAEDLIKLPLVDQIGTLSDEINKLGTQSEKTAVAADIFSDVGKSMGNFLAIGSEGIAQARMETERLGVSFSRAEGKGVEAFLDSLQRLRTAIRGLIQVFVIRGAPAIAKAITDLTNKLSRLNIDAIVGFAKWAAGIAAVVGGLKLINVAMVAITKATVAATLAMEAFAFAIPGGGIVRGAKALGRFLLKRLLPRVAVGAGIFAGTQLAIGALLEDTSKALENTTENTTNWADEMTRVADQLKEVNRAADRTNTRIATAGELGLSTAAPIPRLIGGDLSNKELSEQTRILRDIARFVRDEGGLAP